MAKGKLYGAKVDVFEMQKKSDEREGRPKNHSDSFPLQAKLIILKLTNERDTCTTKNKQNPFR